MKPRLHATGFDHRLCLKDYTCTRPSVVSASMKFQVPAGVEQLLTCGLGCIATDSRFRRKSCITVARPLHDDCSTVARSSGSNCETGDLHISSLCAALLSVVFHSIKTEL
jgi:hypothetical protein